MYQAFKFGSLKTQEELNILDDYFLDQSYVDNFKFSVYDLCLFKYLQSSEENLDNCVNLKRWQNHIEHLSKDESQGNQKNLKLENVVDLLSKNIKVPNIPGSKCKNVSGYGVIFFIISFCSSLASLPVSENMIFKTLKKSLEFSPKQHWIKTVRKVNNLQPVSRATHVSIKIQKVRSQ